MRAPGRAATSMRSRSSCQRPASYSATRAGVIALTKSTAKETACDGIVVTAITPAAAETAMAKEISAERRADILSRIPMGRFVEVEEVARMVLCLTSVPSRPAASSICQAAGQPTDRRMPAASAARRRERRATAGNRRPPRWPRPA
ncbi:SDR family oxidoreductase [Bosea sp. TAF32]|uniref:SDR family oxidoreductase n=1 Tax=Bosea sp. TAF32 TaxID=3237482 RepID=UPI003F8E15AA